MQIEELEAENSELNNKVETLETENGELRSLIERMNARLTALEGNSELEISLSGYQDYRE